MTLLELREAFPDDDTCLEHIMRVRYGDRHDCEKCKKQARYYRVKKRRAYECEHCGYQVYPTAGTPFHKTRTSLVSWFHVMFMFCTTRNGVAAKEIQRQLGCTYKTAWRMGHVIRRYMAFIDGDPPLGGPDGEPVEIDKVFIGGKDKMGEDDKAIVLGMKERGGDVITRVVASRRSFDVIPHVAEHVRAGSTVYTDEAHAWNEIRWSRDYDHDAVNHSKKEYVRGDVHVNSLEGYWSGLKRMIQGTHIWVSKRHLQKYLCEAEFRHNLRDRPWLMMQSLLLAFPSPKRRET
jgi:transposase-like protein/ribosomal protein L37AE/L43A